TWPHTLSTPGMAAMVSSSDSGSVSRSGRVVAWAVNWALARTTTSIWADDDDARWKAASMVSVRTNVPDTRLTARATAAAVRSSRLRWASSPFRTRHISRFPRSNVLAVRAAVRWGSGGPWLCGGSGAEALHVVDGPVGGGIEHLVDHPPVLEEHDAVGHGG